MADNDVRIKLSLDGADKVQSGLAGVGDGAGKADSKLGGMVSKGLAGAGKALVGFATAAVAAGGALTAGVINSYAQYEQNVGGIETLFGDSADKMMEYASQAYATAGLSANQYMEQATSFAAALTGSLEEGADAAAAADAIMVAMSDNANKMGTDIGAIQGAYQGFAKQNFTMLDNLKLGYGGTQTEMQRLLDDAEKLPAAMGQEFDLNNFADVSTAIQLIQEDMGIAGTTALEATETISGSLTMLKGSFDNFLTGLGSADADVAALAGNVINSLETVVSNIAPVIENIGSSLGSLGPQLGTMMEGLVGSVSAAIPGMLEAGTAIIGGLVEGIGGALPGLITAAVPAIVGLVEMIATQLPLLIDAGLQAVVALGQGLVEAIPTLLPVLVTMVTGIAEGIISNLPAILDVALDLVLALAEGIMAAIPVLVEALPGLIDSLVTFLLEAMPTIMEAGIELLLSLVEGLPEIIEGLVEAIPLIITGLVDALLMGLPLIIQAGIDLLLALIQALPEIIVGIVDAIPEIIGGILDALVGAAPQIIQAGIDLFLGLITALPEIIGGLLGAVGEIVVSVLGAIGDSIGKMASAGFELLMGIIGKIGSVVGNIVGAIGDLVGDAVDAVIDGVGDMVSAGGDLVRGIWDGISGAAGWLFDQIGGFVDDVMANIGDFFGIASPSTRMRDEIGSWLPAGLGEGVTEHETDAIKPIVNLNKRIMAEAQSLVLSPALSAARLGPNPIPPMVMAATPLPMPQRATQQNGNDSLSALLRDGVHVAHSDMDTMATKVAHALLKIRRSDGRDAVMAIKQEVL